MKEKGQDLISALIVSVSCALLFLYGRQTKVFLTGTMWVHSFSLAPVSGPFSLRSFLGVFLTSLSSTLVCLSWIFVALFGGLAALKRIQIFPLFDARNLLMASGLGLGLFSLSTFVLGVFHLLYPISALALALNALIISFLELRETSLKPPFHLSPEFRETFREPAAFFMLVFCALILIFHFLGAILPPTSFDEMDYQLALPKLYLLHHGLINTPFNHLSYLPKNMTLLFTLGLLSGGPIVSTLFSWTLGILCVLAVYFFGREKIGSSAAFWGAVFFFLIPVIGNQMRNAVADLGTGFYELIGVFLILEWAELKEKSWLFLSAIFWGLALSSKYTALPGFGIACAFVMFYSSKKGKGRAFDPLVFFSVALSLFLPTMAWNFFWTGNPLTPLLSRWVHSRNFFFLGRYKPLVDYAAGRGIPDYFPLKNFGDVVKLPWRLCVWHNDYNHDLGAAFLAAAPLSFLSLKKKLSPWMIRLSFFIVSYWFFWALIPIHMTRYFVTGLALTSLMFGWWISEIFKMGRGRYLLVIPLGFAFIQQGMRMVYIQNTHKRPWGYLSGRASQDDYIDAILADSPYDAEVYANRHIPGNSTILVFDEFRTFYLNRKFIAATPWDHELWHEVVAQSQNGREISQRLHELGITHFLANDTYLRGNSGFSWADPWSPKERLRAARFIAKRMKRIYTDGNEVWIAQIK